MFEEKEMEDEDMGNDEPKHDWQLMITKMDNGFLLENPYRDSCDAFNQIAITSDDDSDESYEDAKLLMNMLYEISDYFGIYFSKHNKYRLNIIIEDQYPEDDNDEEIAEGIDDSANVEELEELEKEEIKL